MAKKIVLALILSALLCGCGSNSTFNPVNPPSVHAGSPVDPNSIFSGRYIFQSRGQFSDGAVFNEGGTIEADGKGNFTLNSTMNTLAGSTQSASLFHPTNIAGTYSLESNFSGHAAQAQTNDNEALYCNPDGSRCTMVSESLGFTWMATLERD